MHDDPGQDETPNSMKRSPRKKVAPLLPEDRELQGWTDGGYQASGGRVPRGLTGPEDVASPISPPND